MQIANYAHNNEASASCTEIQGEPKTNRMLAVQCSSCNNCCTICCKYCSDQLVCYPYGLVPRLSSAVLIVALSLSSSSLQCTSLHFTQMPTGRSLAVVAFPSSPSSSSVAVAVVAAFLILATCYRCWRCGCAVSWCWLCHIHLPGGRRFLWSDSCHGKGGSKARQKRSCCSLQVGLNGNWKVMNESLHIDSKYGV